VQCIWQAPSATPFPHLGFGYGGGGTAGILDQLFVQTATGMLLAVFRLQGPDYDADILDVTQQRIVLHKMWRDGQLVTLGCAVPQAGYNYGVRQNGRLVGTNDGRAARYIASGGGWSEYWAATLLEGDPPQAYYAVDPLWPGNTLAPGRLGEASALEPYQAGLLLPTASETYAMVDNDSGANFRVYHRGPAEITGSVVVSVSQTANLTYKHPRDMLYVDGSTVAITFRPWGATTPSESSAAWIRLYDTSSAPWDLRWEDTLPGTDQVAAYDPTTKILYSIGKRDSNAILNACWLKRQPASVAAPTIIGGGTALQETTATRLSTMVQDAWGCAISGVLVQWTLESVTSGGHLLSHYSRTNDDGVASITYTGPFAPAGLSEGITATVAEIDHTP
jgi:hypothetical protein